MNEQFGSTIVWFAGHPPANIADVHVFDPDGSEIVPPQGWVRWAASFTSESGLRSSNVEVYVKAYLATRACLLCQRPHPRWFGVFIPDEPRLWPGPPPIPGKVRSFCYAV